MKKRLFKKGFILILTAMFIGLSFESPSGIVLEKTSIQSFNGNILYVGGDGLGNYTSIQDAIEDSSDGDTVFVYDNSSPYYENIVVHKSINLTGENMETTVIDGGGSIDVAYVIADWVNITGFTFKNGGSLIGESGLDVAFSNYVNVSGNNISSNNGYGLYINNCMNCTFSNNIIISNANHGIISSYSSENYIEGNTVGMNSGNGIYLYVQSDSNMVIDNTVSSNSGAGIGFSASDENIIRENTFLGNNYGMRIFSNCANNELYHNNIISNTQQANDLGENIWDSGYPSGGNYWDNHTSPDADGDGIVDNPYNISGGSNKDYYPLTNQFGENRPLANFTYSIMYAFVTFDGTISYDRDGLIESYEWDFGDGNNGSGMIVNHTYSNLGSYNVTLTVTDDDGYTGNLTRNILIEEFPNPPSAPIINGPIKGKAGEDYDYSFVSIDPNDEDVLYFVDWGDETNSSWIGPYTSGLEITLNHTWNERGTYIIRAKAKDIYDFESDWETLEVTMPRGRLLPNILIITLLEKFPNVFSILRYILGLL